VFLLDTNIVSEIVKRAPEAKVLARLNREPPTSLHISSVTVFELRFGAARSAKPASLWARIQRDILGLRTAHCAPEWSLTSAATILKVAHQSSVSGGRRILAKMELLMYYFGNMNWIWKRSCQSGPLSGFTTLP